MATKKQGSQKQDSKGQSNSVIAMEVGAGVLAAAAAGAGYYFYGDKNSKKHRSAASKWAKDMRATVVKQTKKLPTVDQKTVAALVDRAASTYQNVRNIDRNDLAGAAQELKANWQQIQKEIANARGSATKSVASARKSVTKRAGAVKKAVSSAKKSAPKKAAPKKGVSKKTTAKKSTKKAR